MNAPLPESVLKALASLSLDDKYAQEQGRVFMSGIQALVRLPMLQHTRDTMAGLHTAGFISGYRGSPLGGYDQALWKAREHLEAHNVVFQPGVNEELGATAVWGTQQLDLYPEHKRFEGVFGLWYGKGPGVDRCSDVFKHANMAGTARLGGVIAVAGDDHVAKSSSVAHQSDHIFKACGLPVFFPSTVQEILDLGLHAWAMSRFSGLWAGMKTIQEVVESASSVSVDPDRVRIVMPEDFYMPAGGLHIRWPDPPLEQEARLMDYKWYAALAYIRANRLNHTVIDSPHARLGLIASGKAYNDLRQALVDLGLDDATCARIGLRVHKVNVVWPLEATTTREFATGLQEILVIEEKRQVIEYQLKEELYNWREDVRPNVLGKFDEPVGDQTGGEWSRANPAAHWLLRAKADLNPSLVARAVAQRLDALGLKVLLDQDTRRRIDERLALIEAKERPALNVSTQGGKAATDRAPWFCSGCPHNTSTRVPEGSRAMAGIGCHYMVVWMDRSTSTFTQMGGEGVGWVGQAPFTTEKHVFANLGDGTYFHSGLLAVRQSIAAKVNITYKILYNDAVAMTGGQPLDGTLGVPAISRELQAEGVGRIAIVSDEPEKYDGCTDLAGGATVHHRDELDTIQRQMRELPGCTVIIYDQTCATEKRRRRKRGTMAQSTKHVVINELVCEGCGDCSVQSNCLSVEPVDTDFGRKRRINQSTCNQDATCVKGLCPSLVTVEGGTLRKKHQADKRMPSLPHDVLPEPSLPRSTSAYGIVVAGIGGTGVITIGQLLGVAAHIEGKGIVTQDAAGLAQKGGATWSHIQIADSQQAIHTTRVSTGAADLVIACDPLVAAQPATLGTMAGGRTRVALNVHGTPSAAFVHNAKWQFPGGHCDSLIDAAVAGPGDGATADGEALSADGQPLHAVGRLDANQLATALLGDTIYANPLMLGYAWQKGWVPLSRAAILRAIELNEVQVANNQAAFEWGRRAAHDLAAVQRLALPAQPVQWTPRHGQPKAHAGDEASVEFVVNRRAEFLTAYQNAAYARQYVDFIDRVAQAERPLGGHALTLAVARNLFKLMAYKDEYEVARLLSDPAFQAQIARDFEGDYKIAFHLAPPTLGEGGAEGRPAKRRFGAWLRPAMAVLARFKGLRGTPMDPFGHSAERRAERALIAQYRGLIQGLLGHLDASRLPRAVEIARVPEDIRGFGALKRQAMDAAQARWASLLRDWLREEVARAA
ncbi:indolepyruvate ferredoxin oxidoreductase family protein [Aquabacterium soli]|uniref:Indolepyruvate ferredoxin oxidoreductase family protein n=1 Tax=Aquabacterium soli TaxID=2493092 RepID=A0A3R8TCK3_9BURK|nr:indolepyruvate ferredoxin oxidoreductase family protein [Aquabacterium soli]RRS04661.1 indolepyruvate ferredoxin oxidoreductase family protein [Aquabacterium soli]